MECACVSGGKTPNYVLSCGGGRPRTSFPRAARLESSTAIGSHANSLEVWDRAIVIKFWEATGTKTRQIIRQTHESCRSTLTLMGLLYGGLQLGQCLMYRIKLDGTGFNQVEWITSSLLAFLDV